MKATTWFSGAVLTAVLMTASGFKLFAGAPPDSTGKSGVTQTVKYHYDEAGRLTSVTYNDEVTIGYTYDRAGNITAITSQPTATAVEGEPNGVPRIFALHANYPNPFNPTTAIQYDLPKRSRVLLEVFDIQGRKIGTLLDEEQSAGYHTVEWGAETEPGSGVASGVYLLRMKAGTFVATQRMVLMK